MSDKHNSQWSLLGKNNFGPLFWTQFLGAFNDNLYKNALIFLLTFGSLVMPGSMKPEIAVQISAGLFILPFFLFSAWAGELADCSEKSQLIRYLKIWEIGIAITGAFGLFYQNVYFMWAALFGLGVQATFFGPLKYSILPQHLKETELVGGNALIESGTFIAILLGTILGGVLISITGGWKWVSLGCLVVAVLGYISARKIPIAPAVAPDLKMNWNIIEPSIKTIKLAKEVRSVFLSILGISWFWFFGATLLAQFPSLVKDVVGGREIIVTLFLGIFSVGTGVGSMLCEKMSGKKVEIGLVPFGAFGLSVFAYLLYRAFVNFTPLHDAGLSQFIAAKGSYNIMIELFFMSVFGGFFIVPLYALIQTRSREEVRSRIIAANNILNALFMVSSAIFAIGMFSLGLTVKELILALAILNTVVAIYIFTVVPEFLLRFLVWILMATVYRIKTENLDTLPEDGPAILVCNHVSFLDGLMIFGLSPRPVKFVMYYKIFNIP
jgi:MFS family permease